MDEKEWLTR
jgi:hypothetical protein